VVLSRAFQAAGLEPPVGLLTLPTEIKDQVLGLLTVSRERERQREALFVG
jgi:hypothetical protein